MAPVGFIQSELDLKLLVLYIMDHVAGPITFNEIGDANRDGAFIKTANTVDGVWDFVKVQTVG